MTFSPCRTVAALLALAAGGLGAQAAEGPVPEGWFPFTMNPAEAVAGSPVDLSFLNGGPAEQRIIARDGHFLREGRGPVRFLGTNVTFSGAFPAKEVAPAVAARLAQLGFNVVRFHHMDARDIWLPEQAGLDPAKLDRLDWFIFQLKQHGIYSNLNLHVSRTYPGLPAQDSERGFRYGKIVDTVHEPFIALQERYARDLLDRVNPYTGLRLAEDPAIAFVELNNENTLLALTPALLEALPTPAIREDMRRQWGAWLAGRYADVPAVTAAWDAGAQPLGAEMLRNPGFEGDLSGWTLEGTAPGVCEMERAAGEEEGVLRVSMSQPGRVAWAYQVHQIGLTLTTGATYTVRLRVRAEPARRASVSLRLAAAPWTMLSPSRDLPLGPAWTEHTLVFRVGDVPVEPPKRFSVSLGDQPGEVWLASPSLRPGRELFRAEGVASLADMGLPGSTAPGACWADFRRFLVATERAYVGRLRALLKDRLGVCALVVDSQGSYGGYWGLWREASLGDYVDMHAYWQHPSFPGRPWDPANWTIGNTSMVAAADGGTLPRLVTFRHQGMPFSVSEYNHPAPNDHAAELFPLIGAVGALQDWDAIYQFAYCNHADGYGPGRIGGHFELCHHPAQLVFAPLAALIFRQGLVAPAATALTVSVPMGSLESGLEMGFSGPDTLLPRERLPPWAMLGSRFSVRLDAGDTGTSVAIPDLGVPPPAGVLLQTPQVAWTLGAAARFTAAAPAARLAIGRLGGQSLRLGDITLRLDLPEGQWACAGLVSVDAKALADSSRALLVVVTRAENSGMVWDEARRSVGRNWGREPAIVQAVPFTLEGAGPPPRAMALDARGAPAGDLSVSPAGAGWRLAVPAGACSAW